MSGTQDVYATNLLQHYGVYGYPLHSPQPGSGLGRPYDTEGIQIGDVGYVDSEGVFHPLRNICFPDKQPLFPGHKPIDFGDPCRTPNGLMPGQVFMTGVHREVKEPSSGPMSYEFAAKSNTGAILILPSGATYFTLPPENFQSHLEAFREAATKHAHSWCEHFKQESLYLVTGVYKTCDFALTSFHTGHHDGKIRADPDAGTYKWTTAFTAHSRASPRDNKHENQTVLIKGFRMTVRWRWLPVPVVEWIARSQSPIWRNIGFFMATLIALLRALFVMASTWLSRTSVEHFPPFSRSFHPSDTINHYLLDVNPRASVAITHDDEWVDMLEKKGLQSEDLIREDRFRAFLEREYGECAWEPNRDVVYLPSQAENTNDTDRNSEFSQPMTLTEDAQIVITHIRAENVTVGLERVPIGFYVQVDIAGHEFRQTEIKSMPVYDCVIQWDDMIHLPSDPSTMVKLTVCASYEFSPMLGKGESLHVLEKTVGELLNHTCPFTFSGKDIKDPPLCSSLLVSVQKWHCSHWTPPSNEEDVTREFSWPAQVTEATDKGRQALLCYYKNHDAQLLVDSITNFNDALINCGDGQSCRAAALFNLATAEFISYRSHGALDDFDKSTTHYRDALELRRDDHQDRPMTLLCLAQVLLHRSKETGDDTFYSDELFKLIHELRHICPEGTHGRRAADLVFQSYELFRLCNSNDLSSLDELISTLDAAAQEPPDRYFDRRIRFNNLGLALRKRFQLGRKAIDLDRAIEWLEKAVQLTPTNHPERSRYLSDLGNAVLLRFQRRQAVPLSRKR